MRIPNATYRVQLNSAFTFESLKKVVPYLSQLGISHIYASPIFTAKKGSSHGYDIIDVNSISQELGGKEAFEDLQREVKAAGLSWLQDIVPNHASYSLENRSIVDLLERGVDSKYSSFFDVDWNYPSPKLSGKVLAPFLTEPYSKCLNEGKLQLVFNGGFKVQYGGLQFPVNAETQKLLGVSSQEKTLAEYRDNPELLDKLLSIQFYKLSHWKTALKHINYRRFFDIIDLIGLRAENLAVFAATHKLILQLAASGAFSGLRVDHIDGLFEPEKYLKTLRQQVPDAYLVVEKILTGEEQLCASWPVQGTTGYDYLNCANQVFVQSKNEPQFTSIYHQFSGNKNEFSDLLYESKKLAVETYFLGDAQNLARLFCRTLRKLTYNRPSSGDRMKQAAIELLACFPIYRTYLGEQPQNNEPFLKALSHATQRNRDLADEFSAISFLLKNSGVSNDELAAVMRFQQFTGAVMAKGFEDTALYRYNRLLSLNEVGGSPQRFGMSAEEFHKFNALRQQNWPLTMNATSTHDTKRGEDTSARLNALSEIPAEFKVNLEEWSKLNADKKTIINGKPAPDRNEEYYLYQTLLGAYPWLVSDKQDFTPRIKLHMAKALREAKVHSSWIDPNLRYEEAAADFAAGILGSISFLDAFLPFQEKIAWYGFFNTLAQTLLKITCPGIPDFYQGSELWYLSLVDPDNRRPVNYPTRQNLLSEVTKLEPKKASDLLDSPSDAKAKLYVIYRGLQLRRKLKGLFEQGAYIPLVARGVCSNNVVAFARQRGDAYVLVIVPRFFTSLIKPNSPWSNAKASWDDTQIALPETAPARWTEALTNRPIHSQYGRLPVRDVLDRFPVALLYSGEVIG